MKPRWAIAEDDLKHLFDLRAYYTRQKEEYLNRLASSSPGSQQIRERILMMPENQEEKRRFLSMLSPALPPQQQAQHTRQQDGRSSGSAPPNPEVDALLLAASGAATEGVTATGGGPSGDRWMAVNTLPSASNASSMTPPMSLSTQQQTAAGYPGLDELAGFAAQQGKMGNGGNFLPGGPVPSEPRMTQMKQESVQHQQQHLRDGQMGGGSAMPPSSSGGMEDVQVDDSRWIDERAGGRGWGSVQVGAID